MWSLNPWLTGLLAPLLWLGCAGIEAPVDDRARWLREGFLRDNRDLLERAAEQVAGKALKMARDPYAYLRGTANVYWRDCLEPGGALRQPTAFGIAAPVALVGDSHPENFGVLATESGEFAFEINDFDGATWGPYPHEVRRLALGFAVLASQAGLEALPLARAVARGYVEAILGPRPPAAPRWGRAEDAADGPVILADLVRRSARDGAARAELVDETEGEGPARRLRRGILEPGPEPGVAGDTRAPVDQATEARLRAALRAYPQSLHPAARAGRAGLVIHDLVHRIGAGVSSYAVDRFYLLVTGSALEEPVILEVKELLDPPQFTGLALLQPRRAQDQGDRVVRAQRARQHSPTADPWLGFARSGPQSLLVRRRSAAFKGVSVARILGRLADGRFAAADLEALALTCGAVLAAAHTRTPTLGGVATQPLLRAALARDPEGFVDETGVAAEAGLAVTLADAARFAALVEIYGPTLGYRSGGQP